MKNIFLLLLVLVCFSCASKKMASAQEISTLNNTVNKGNFKFVATYANPLGFNNVKGLESLLPPGSTLGSINLINSVNYFLVKNDSIKVDLPYYGEKQLSTGYNNNNNSLEFEGKAKTTKKDYQESKQRFVIKYNLKNDQENLQVFLTLFPNKSALLRVNSSHRTSISYNGSWEVIE